MTTSTPTAAPSALNIDAAHAAILSLDVQAGIVSVYVKDESFVPRAASTLRAARKAGLPVVHVKVGFRPLVPEASPRNLFLSAIKASAPHQRFFQEASGAIHPDLGVGEHDLIVTKSPDRYEEPRQRLRRHRPRAAAARERGHHARAVRHRDERCRAFDRLGRG